MAVTGRKGTFVSRISIVSLSFIRDLYMIHSCVNSYMSRKSLDLDGSSEILRFECSDVAEIRNRIITYDCHTCVHTIYWKFSCVKIFADFADWSQSVKILTAKILIQESQACAFATGIALARSGWDLGMDGA